MADKNIGGELGKNDKDNRPAPQGSGNQAKDESKNKKRKNFEELYGSTGSSGSTTSTTSTGPSNKTT